ncbi:MAG: hypothetical protein LBT42_07970 [Tannerella sp.]|jgi:hypothetical protein|nr:hypothetical protein [Tannerella sp.]
MRKLFLLFMAIALNSMFFAINAQDNAGLSDEALSAKYKQEIKIMDSEIKTIRLKLKAETDNNDLKSELAVKTEQLKELKSKKKVLDEAVNSKKAAQKAAQNAEKAKEKAERAQKKAERDAEDAKKIKEKQ